MQLSGMAPRSRQADDCSLAGLGFSFDRVSLRQEIATKVRSEGRSLVGSDGADRAPGARAVVFNLRERQPGAAYGSPDAQQAAAADIGQQKAAEGIARRGAMLAPPPVSSSLAQLKQASLRRRAATLASRAPASAGPPPNLCSAQPSVRPTLSQSAREPESVAAELVGSAARGHTADSQHAQPLQDADTHQYQLLLDMEALLAGCSAAVLDEQASSPAPQQYMLLGRPVLAVPPPAQETATGGGEGAPRDAAWRAGSAGAVLSCADCMGAPKTGSIAAHRPTPHRGSSDASLSKDRAPTAAHWAEAAADGPDPPESLDQALQCLGLLAPPQGAEASSRAAAVEGVAAQRWFRLRAVQVAVAAKMAAGAETDLLPLVRRLRQVRLHLEFHKASGACIAKK